MRNMIASLLVFSAVLMLTPVSDAQAGSAAINIFYSAKRRGNLERCGCHLTAEGGIAQEPTIYTARSKGLPEIRVDAGEWMEPLSPSSPVSAAQSRVLLLGLENLKYEVINMTAADALMSPEYIGFFAKQHPKAVEPLISANIYLRDDPSRRAFPPYKILERKLGDGRMYRIGVTGVTDANKPLVGLEKLDPKANNGAIARTPGYIIKDPAASLQPIMLSLQNKADLVVVLHAGDFNGAKALVDAVTEITYLITTANPPDRVSPHYFAGANMLFVVSPSGRQIGAMTLRPRAPGWEFESRPEMIDVKPVPNPDPTLNKLVEDFNKVSGKDSVSTETTKLRRFTGAHRCIVCHGPNSTGKKDIYTSWKATPHGRAIDRLVIEGEQFNPDRLKRATTGFGEPGGFTHPRQIQSQLLMNVQCEACHGPAIGHVEAETRLLQPMLPPDEKAKVQEDARKTMPVRKVPESTCLKCHDQSFSPDFNYARDYEKVKH